MNVSRGMLSLAATACLVLIAAQLAVAQEPIDKTLRASPNGTVVISNVAGTVQITGSSDNEIHVTGTLGRNSERLDFSVEGRRAEIKVILPHNGHDVEPTDLRISLPRESRVEATTVSATIDVDEVAGELKLESVSGDVTVLGQPAGTDVQTVSGGIKITAGAPHTHAQSVSGDIQLDRMIGEVEVNTVSGDAHVTAGKLDRLDARSVSGNLVCATTPAANGALSLNSHSGDIELDLPAGVDADFSVSTFSGNIESAFGSSSGSRSHRHAPGSEMSFTTGSGGANIEVQTFSGDVNLRKR